mmetsp:Transcript_14182/g.33441  ORF Transcript_14182/g.33441 Transcript_14182/m.33441 type:complete len:622 (-) Transcript_14182:216-2081(-)
MVSRARVLPLVVLVVLVIACFVGVDGKKKKKSKGSKNADAGLSTMRCGVCMATIDEIRTEQKKTENSTSTLDLRWGLTSEVKEGRAKRIGKVIPYKRSELRSIEIMEKVCERMKDYVKFGKVPGEFQLKLHKDIKDVWGEDLRNDKDKSGFERTCEEFIEKEEEAITTAIRDDLSEFEMEDAICFGGAEAPCGEKRQPCTAGSSSEFKGLSPCTLCEYGQYQPDSGAEQCVTCEAGRNTTGRGSKEVGECLEKCKPGTFSKNGLGGLATPEGVIDCDECGVGTYQPEEAQTECVACPDGKSTAQAGSIAVTQCVSICGDSRKSTEEECDDGNTDAGDGCDQECKVEAGHVCKGDVGAASTCRKVVCGDGNVDTAQDGSAKEECDDGNTEDGDGCSATCAFEAGFNCKEKDGKSTCSKVECGDRKRQGGHEVAEEECDDGNKENGDGCSADCKVESTYICTGAVDFKSRCNKVKCGDGWRERSGELEEQCDDGNEQDGDGCSSACKIEGGYSCSSKNKRTNAVGPAEFYSHARDSCKSNMICGDMYRVGDEECDDGNKEDGDGCSSKCKVEKGFVCDEAVPNACMTKEAKKKDEEKKKAEEAKKKEGGFFSNMFGSKKEAEL